MGMPVHVNKRLFLYYFDPILKNVTNYFQQGISNYRWNLIFNELKIDEKTTYVFIFNSRVSHNWFYSIVK